MQDSSAQELAICEQEETEKTPEHRHPAFYKGVLFGLEKRARSRGQCEIVVSPDNFELLKDLTDDYEYADSRTEALMASNIALWGRIRELERALKPFADEVQNEAARNTTRTTKLAVKIDLKHFLAAHETLIKT